MTRRAHDQYFTPAHAVRSLLPHISLSGLVLECCVGEGAIRSELMGLPGVDGVYGNDIDRRMVASTYFDAANPESWRHFTRADWVITNPPFNQASQIVPLAYEHAEVGIAMLLRMSFLEPCLDRDLWLQKHPPNKLLVLPRISFTGDGKTDNVTCAWMIWEKSAMRSSYIRVIPREGR